MLNDSFAHKESKINTIETKKNNEKSTGLWFNNGEVMESSTTDILSCYTFVFFFCTDANELVGASDHLILYVYTVRSCVRMLKSLHTHS